MENEEDLKKPDASDPNDLENSEGVTSSATEATSGTTGATPENVEVVPQTVSAHQEQTDLSQQEIGSAIGLDSVPQSQSTQQTAFNPNANAGKKKSGVPAFLFGLGGVLVGAMLTFLLLGGTRDIPMSVGESDADSDDVQTAMMAAAEAVSPSVVGIANIKDVPSGLIKEADSATAEVGTGSGVIYKVENGEAYIVTNNHVVEGADSLEVTLSDGEKRPATLVGADPWTDLAVIKMDGTGIDQVATFGDSDNLQQGEPVIAIGNPLGVQFSGSVTAGVVSGLNRTVPVDINGDGTEDWNAEVIQTDAAVNPGNSGGALVNMQGEVIGINSMKIAESSVEGMCFAIPSNTVVTVIADLEEFGQVQRPYLGVGLKPLNEISMQDRNEVLKLPEDQKDGVVVTSVEEGGPAADAGLQPLDVIVEIEGEPTPDMPTFRQVLYSYHPGDTIELKFYRNGKLETTKVTLGQAPAAT